MAEWCAPCGPRRSRHRRRHAAFRPASRTLARHGLLLHVQHDLIAVTRGAAIEVGRVSSTDHDHAVVVHPGGELTPQVPPVSSALGTEVEHPHRAVPTDLDGWRVSDRDGRSPARARLRGLQRDRDLTAKGRVGAPPHLAHAALVDLGGDFVNAETGAGSEGHVLRTMDGVLTLDQSLACCAVRGQWRQGRATPWCAASRSRCGRRSRGRGGR